MMVGEESKTEDNERERRGSAGGKQDLGQLLRATMGQREGNGYLVLPLDTQG